MTPDLDQPALGIATARADEIRAELLLRVRDAWPGLEGRPSLEGTLTGPHRGSDATLPTSVPLVGDAMPGGWSRATFTEPAFWTPDMPNLYRLESRLVDDGRTLSRCDRMLGLRRLGVRGRSCWLDGRRWVPRGVSAGPAFDPAELRGLRAAAEIRDPAPHLLAAADATGVAIIARLEDAAGRPLDEAESVGRIAGWALHPSSMIVVIPRTTPVGVAAAVVDRARVVKDTMLLAVEVDGTRPPHALDEGLAAAAALLVVDLPADTVPHAGWREWPMVKPLVARWRDADLAGGLPAEDQAGCVPTAADRLATLRCRCDHLQAVLAGWGLAGSEGGQARDWAGYLAATW